MFKPEMIIFSATNRCNLNCSHCHTAKGNTNLNIESAMDFLRNCHNSGINNISFSGGGEPFLAVDFITSISKLALDLDMQFDRLMTNGDWWHDKDDLYGKLEAVYESGFDGRIGLSYDKYHGQTTERINLFINAVFEVYGIKTNVEILSVKSDNSFYDNFSKLASLLKSELLYSDDKPIGIINNKFQLHIPILVFPYSASPDENAWDDDAWFKDDYCAGPGNIFFVHENGLIAPCCGFANEDEALIIGNVRDGYEKLMLQAKKNSYVNLCYVTGLGRVRELLQEKGYAFAGKTMDMCFFCSWLLKNKTLLDKL